ncbi:hypothetical protein AX16_009174 [Volvariella volvacea WC 439]|nr:hypothetical protein AX16_009174 [Volvariella volvacea WC 439]
MLTFELESKGQCKIEIWRVSLEYDSHSSTSNLVAHRLKSFQPEPYGRVPTISILGEYLAYSLVHDEADIKHAIVMRWVDLGDTPSNYDKWAKRTQFSMCVRLLPQGYILLRNGSNVFLYNYLSFPRIRDISELGVGIGGILPLWVAHPDKHTHQEYIPEVTFCRDSVRMITSTKSEVYGLLIRNPEDGTMSNDFGEMVKLGDIPRGTFFTFAPEASHGYRHSALWEGSTLTLIHHPWPDDACEKQFTVVQKKPTLRGEVHLPPESDIGAGRMVISYSSKMPGVPRVALLSVFLTSASEIGSSEATQNSNNENVMQDGTKYKKTYIEKPTRRPFRRADKGND